MQRLSSETHSLSRDPNLADRNYFDAITRDNYGPRLKIRTKKGAYGTARAWTRKTRTPAKEESGHLRAPQPQSK
jgi:hypothetical protein